MTTNFYVIEKRLKGGSIYFEGMDEGEILFTNEIDKAKRYEHKVDAVRERSDLGLVEKTTVEEHQY